MKRRQVCAATASSALALTAVLVNTSPASATITKRVSFDETSGAPTDFQHAAPLRERYAGKGIHFKGPSSTDGGALIDEDGSWAAPPRSGDQFLAFNAASAGGMTNGGSPIGPETISFDRLQNVVSIYVYQGGFNVGTATFTMVAKRAGNTVDTAEVTTTTEDWALLRVSAPRGIRKVVLNADDPDDAWAADDLTIKRN